MRSHCHSFALLLLCAFLDTAQPLAYAFSSSGFGHKSPESVALSTSSESMAFAPSCAMRPPLFSSSRTSPSAPLALREQFSLLEMPCGCARAKLHSSWKGGRKFSLACAAATTESGKDAAEVEEGQEPGEVFNTQAQTERYVAPDPVPVPNITWHLEQPTLSQYRRPTLAQYRTSRSKGLCSNPTDSYRPS
eukprot:3799968-Rhodomonas_salina.2